MVSPHREPQSGLLGLSWAPLGPLLRALGAVWGASWAPLGALLGHLGAILRPQRPIGSEKARMPKTLIFRWLLKDFCILEGAVEGSKGTWIRLGALLGPLGGMSEAILTHLEVSWAILEAILRLGAPLGAILSHLARSNASRGAPPRPRGGGRGRGQDTLPARKPSRSLPPALPPHKYHPSVGIARGRRWMDSHWEPKQMPGARRSPPDNVPAPPAIPVKIQYKMIAGGPRMI